MLHEPQTSVLPRRLFLADLGRGAVAVAILGIAGCAPASPTPSPLGSAGRASFSPGTPGTSPGGSAASGGASAATGSGGGGSSASGGATAWTRVNLGFVSAYLLVRGGEVAIVDTGVSGSEGAIAASLTGIGLGWGDVAHVILTHKHQDHAGSIAAVLGAATGATGYIGSKDLPSVASPRPLTAVDDGDTVFGLRIVGSPGHTIGHVSVLDEAGGVLVAGDALGTRGGTLAGSSPQFTEDTAAAQATIVKLGRLHFETLLVGHGDPIPRGAAAEVAALGAR